ncbi:hypothetical protein GR702_01285 [Novosphingobium sp. FGD1]|uniref:Uncharacterized protein n=1 Tax=Novosphingobium silvae TaxID=2692619 RepID=A0A7X4GD21_9SPHN|nr:hypothetical protein [Novosphingobium silvae]MYL96408.1 hypothetical protein [Novosphingobium silvae]
MNISPAALFEAPDLDLADFDANLRAIRTASQPLAFEPVRLAAAYRAKPRRLWKPVPTFAAPTPGPCPNCGTRGVIGCEHFLPFGKEAGRG